RLGIWTVCICQAIGVEHEDGSLHARSALASAVRWQWIVYHLSLWLIIVVFVLLVLVAFAVAFPSRCPFVFVVPSRHLVVGHGHAEDGLWYALYGHKRPGPLGGWRHKPGSLPEDIVLVPIQEVVIRHRRGIGHGGPWNHHELRGGRDDNTWGCGQGR